MKQPTEEPAAGDQPPLPHIQPISTEGKAHTTTLERVKNFYEMIDTWMCVWKLVSAILLCAGRYFLTPTSYKPLAAYPTALAQLMPVIHWMLMGAFIFSARRQTHHTQAAGAAKEDNAELPRVDEAELEAKDAELEEDSEDKAEAIREKAESATEAQPQLTEAPREVVQEDLMMVIEILVHEIKLKDPQSWSQMEQLLVSRWNTEL